MKLEKLARKFNYTCVWCKEVYPLEALSRDHYKPLNDRFENHRDRKNSEDMVLACKVCNLKKSNNDPLVFKKTLRFKHNGEKI
jgi:5-methylcytosine-specific restriction endonuclease McrA